MDARTARCLLIAKVLSADGFITAAERAVLESAMDAVSLPDRERRRVRDMEGFEEAAETARGLALEERRALMDELLAAALADGKLSPHEQEAIAALTAAIGLS